METAPDLLFVDCYHGAGASLAVLVWRVSDLADQGHVHPRMDLRRVEEQTKDARACRSHEGTTRIRPLSSRRKVQYHMPGPSTSIVSSMWSLHLRVRPRQCDSSSSNHLSVRPWAP
jgi:hypothetical protein